LQILLNAKPLLDAQFVACFVPMVCKIENKRRRRAEVAKSRDNVSVLGKRQRVVEPGIAVGEQIERLDCAGRSGEHALMYRDCLLVLRNALLTFILDLIAISPGSFGAC
jgi:hypothetical protein